MHGSLDEKALNGYCNYIAGNVCLDDENVLSIGCGDGTVDNYLMSNYSIRSISGFDFSYTNIARAKEKNIGKYWVQSFLDDYPNCDSYTFVYSLGVVQYCAPCDLPIFFKKQIDSFHSAGTYRFFHVDIPDISKADRWYNMYSKLSKEYIRKRCDSVKYIFYDGSFWHDMDEIQKKLSSLGAKAIRVIDGPGQYRSSVYFEIVK